MFSNTEKVRKRQENTICLPDSKYKRKEGPKLQWGRFCIYTEEKSSNSKDGRVLKLIPRGSCGFAVTGCL